MSVIGIKCTFQYCPLVFWIKRKLFLNVQMQANTISLGVFLLLLLSLLFVCLSLLFVFLCVCVCVHKFPSVAPMGSPSRGGGVSRLSLPTPFSPIFVCPSAYRNLSPVLLFTHQLLPTYLQFSSSDCPFCLHRPFTYISLLYKPSFCHFSFSLWFTRDPAR